MIDRYSRQTLFPGIGRAGQKKLDKGFAVVVGCGALGTIAASALVRAGVGKVRIIDRDFIEYHNLQRQVLFDEEDIRNEIPKAIAAERHLQKVNSSIDIEGVVADVNFANVEQLVRGADVILDGLDNMETRFVINDAALKLNIPWVYGGAIAATGMTMNIVPGKTACLRCISGSPVGNSLALTCDTAGVISPAPWITGSLQVAEAFKIMVGSKEISRELVVLDVWEGTFRRLKIERRQDCPACRGEYEFLKGKYGTRTAKLCGQNAVQVLGAGIGEVSFSELAAKLRPVGQVSYNDYMLQLAVEGQEMVVFPDGRAIVKNTTDESAGRALYSKYIGS
ncbi:MAG: ThiF family adenylyltransferase [Dehalococcoidales bacterium]|nr:ThiF family adenylyltransferase [Dehalococcoidales bacterium]